MGALIPRADDGLNKKFFKPGQNIYSGDLLDDKRCNLLDARQTIVRYDPLIPIQQRYEHKMTLPTSLWIVELRSQRLLRLCPSRGEWRGCLPFEAKKTEINHSS
jgi:hypothetical protein